MEASFNVRVTLTRVFFLLATQNADRSTAAVSGLEGVSLGPHVLVCHSHPPWRVSLRQDRAFMEHLL